MLSQWDFGNHRKQERLEFLYDSGLQVGKVAQADEYLLGKPVEEAVQPESDIGQVKPQVPLMNSNLNQLNILMPN